jgi:NitT/TauT family transport system substrate-binding protein
MEELMRSRPQRILALLVTPALVVGMAACGGGSGPSSSTASDSTAPTATGGAAAEPITVRVAVIESSSAAYLPTLLSENGIDVKHGVKIEIVPISKPGEQWNAVRSGAADLQSGSWLDLLRQRAAGLKLTAIGSFSTFGNPIVALPDKPYGSLADLKGARIGTPGESLLDWMILRTAAKRAGIDLSTDAEVQSAAPGLINELLDKGDLDAALQFSDFTFAPVSQGKYREVTTLPKALDEAGLDPNSLYLTWNLADAWRQAHPDAVADLVAALDEGVDLLETDDSVWPALAKRSGVTDAKLLEPFVAMQRASFDAPYSEDQLAPTRALLDEIVSVVGAKDVGVESFDESAFDFESASVAAKP